MELRDFPSVLDTPRMVISTPIPTVTEQVIVRQPSQARSFKLAPSVEWGWREINDYVVVEIEKRFGVFPRDAAKEASIFKGFCSRWGSQAGAIAQAAFEVHDGRWRGSPVSVTRFCAGSDVYFAQIIAERLTEGSIAGW